jgi:hypothetical protein
MSVQVDQSALVLIRAILVRLKAIWRRDVNVRVLKQAGLHHGNNIIHCVPEIQNQSK